MISVKYHKGKKKYNTITLNAIVIHTILSDAQGIDGGDLRN